MCCWFFSTVMILEVLLSATTRSAAQDCVTNIDADSYESYRKYSDCNYESPIEVTATEETQIIISPTYPDPYVPDTQCRWKIDTHDPNRVIHFKMVDFVIEQSATCNKDFVELKDGLSTFSRIIKTWCGEENANKPEGILMSTTADTLVTFKTNKAGSARGFQLRFWSASKNSVEYTSVKYGFINYLLHIIFAGIVSSLACVAIVSIFFRKYKKPMDEPTPPKKPSKHLKNNNLHIVNEASPIKRADSISNSSFTTTNSRNRLIGSTHTLTTPV